MKTVSTEALERGLLLTLMQRQTLGLADLVAMLCEVVPSKGADEKHIIIGDPPQMEELKTQGQGPRKITALTSGSVTVTNKVYQASIRFGRDDMRRDRAGAFQRTISRGLDVVLNFPNKRVTDLITSGTSLALSTDTYDGVAFFSSSHTARKDEGVTGDNLLDGTGTTTSALATDIATVVSTFKSVKAENGEPYFGDITPEILFMFPPALEKAAREALNATIISNTTNVMAGIGKPYFNPRLADTNDWYAFVTNPGWRQFVFQPETSVEVDTIAEGSELWKRERQGEFILSQALGAGYLGWQSALKVVNA
jgi:hypothetical protein